MEVSEVVSWKPQMENVIRDINGIAISKFIYFVSKWAMPCWWIVIVSSDVDWRSFKTNLRDFSGILFIFLFSPLDENIQIRGQYKNWWFSKVNLEKGDVNFVILAGALALIRLGRWGEKWSPSLGMFYFIRF